MFKSGNWKIVEDFSEPERFRFGVYQNCGFIFDDWWVQSFHSTREEAEVYIENAKKVNNVWYY